VPTLPLLNIILPIGLSFHTFQAMSYTIEVYRGNYPAERHLGLYALYVMFYPQLVTGRNILRLTHTRYQLVISPLYQQQQLNPADLAILQRLFGAASVHDFSGINLLTQSIGNYYDEYYYRPAVGRQILKAIYAPALPGGKH
jgi:hypothetical protein